MQLRQGCTLAGAARPVPENGTTHEAPRLDTGWIRLNQAPLPRQDCDRTEAIWRRWPEYPNVSGTYRGRGVQERRVISDEQVAGGDEAEACQEPHSPGRIEGSIAHLRSNACRKFPFMGATEQQDFAVRSLVELVGGRRKGTRRPTFETGEPRAARMNANERTPFTAADCAQEAVGVRTRSCWRC